MTRTRTLLTILGVAFSLAILPMWLAALEAHARQPAAPATSSYRFRLDPGQSKFIAHALRGGLLWFKGHEHLVAAREFSGEVMLSPGTITPASLELTVKTDS